MTKDYISGFLGEKATFRSRKWGYITVTSASFTDAVDGDLIVTLGSPQAVQAPLVRIHSECVFAEAFDSELCDCKDQLDIALTKMRRDGAGILFYLRLDGRGIGLAAKVKATALEVGGIDTYESRRRIGQPTECRDFKAIGLYLRENGFEQIRLLTNNPGKISDISSAGILVTAESLIIENPNREVRRLYATKRVKFGHLIPEPISDRQLALGLYDEEDSDNCR
jgi:GTP cyclohydrolase II